MVAKLNLNSTAVRNLAHPETGQLIVWDQAVPGFGVRLTRGSKTYIAETRVAGRTRRVSIGPTDLYRIEEARREAKKLLGSMAGGTDVNAARAEARARTVTLEQAADLYFANRSLKPSTEAEYRGKLRVHFSDWMDRELRTISPQAFVQRFDHITERAGPATANGAARVFSAVWNFARAWTAAPDGTPTLLESPTHRLTALKKFHPAKRRAGHLPLDAFPAFFSALDSISTDQAGRDFADFAEFLLRTGCRKGEASKLIWERVNMEDGTFTFVDTKNGRDHTLPMSSQIRAIFKRRSAMRGGEHVFYPETRAGRADPRKTLARFRQALGQEIMLHDLRRTFAIMTEKMDLPYSVTKRLMNHADGRDVTLGYLVHDADRLRGHIQRLNDEFDHTGKRRSGGQSIAYKAAYS